MADRVETGVVSRLQVNRPSRGLTDRQRHLAILATWIGWLACLCPPAGALLKIDFEQKFFMHPGKEVWDFCVIRPDSLYHIFYITYDEGVPNARCLELGHAISPDLCRWTIVSPAVSAGPDWWDADNVWAPDVVWNDARQCWTMLYTGVDSLKVQRACAAHSFDLFHWNKDRNNPVFVPDSSVYYWSPTLPWSSFRDPFLYQEGGVWNMLSTAGVRQGGYPGSKVGIVHRAVSIDLVNWTDSGSLYKHSGSASVMWHDMESVQYLQRGAWHHLFTTEQNVFGVSHLVAGEVGAWDHATRTIIDWGTAPEIDSFDPGKEIFSRFTVNQHPLSGVYFYVVRFDTLRWDNDGRTPIIFKPHPLDRDFAYRTGASALANPTWGDNPVERGEPSSGLVGLGWFGSQEYFQGPLSGRGSPGSRLGDIATGRVKSHPFFIEGDFIRLLVGGGYYPTTCTVALMDAEADTAIFCETGHGAETMTPRTWNVRPFRGRLAYIEIVDAETGPFGHINVDEIEEILDSVASVEPQPAAVALRHLGAFPNPANPTATVRFTLSKPGLVRLTIVDGRGRLVWRSAERHVLPGAMQGITWKGVDTAGRAAATGTYLYQLELDGRRAAKGKLTLVR